MNKSTCTIDGCDKPNYGRGWCKNHYLQAWKRGDLEKQPRKISKPDATLDERLRNIGWTVTAAGCWEWNGALDKYGYGQIAVNRGRPWKAYRIAYEAWVKTPEPNVDICHKCDNPPCINPAHLFEGSRQVNVTDMISKGRQATWSKRPHKLTGHEVEAIRAAYTTGKFYYRDLAREYGVSQTLIGLIINRKRRTAA